MTTEDIAEVMRQIPGLTAYGVGPYHAWLKLPGDQFEAKVEAERKKLLGSAAICTKVCDWLLLHRPAKAVADSPHTSYELKHAAQAAIGDDVSNGQFIAAAVHCAIPYRLIPDSPNVRFGIFLTSEG